MRVFRCVKCSKDSVTNAGIEALGQLKTDEKKHKKGKSGYEGTEDDNWPQGKFWEQTNISFPQLQLCPKYIITTTLFDTEIGPASQSSSSINLWFLQTWKWERWLQKSPSSTSSSLWSLLKEEPPWQSQVWSLFSKLDPAITCSVDTHDVFLPDDDEDDSFSLWWWWWCFRMMIMTVVVSLPIA